MSSITDRKASHLALCATEDVGFQQKSNLFEEVEFEHNALPELNLPDIDLSTTLFGKRLRAPLVIAGMSGGVALAEDLNRRLATTAEELGIAFGFGSMRPLLEQGITAGYKVREHAPTAVLIGNIGAIQARDATDQQLLDLIGSTGLDGLAVHLNPAQEVVQSGGDTDFRGALGTFQRLCEILPIPVIAKETGCGISRGTADQLIAAGVPWVDVGGSGGTSWVGVETLRARASTERLGRLFWDWGIPTAASVLHLRERPIQVIATGGLRSGLDLAKAITLGAQLGGIARPFLQAWTEDKVRGPRRLAMEITHELRISMLLTGCSNLTELRAAPVFLGRSLLRWAHGAHSLNNPSKEPTNILIP